MSIPFCRARFAFVIAIGAACLATCAFTASAQSPAPDSARALALQRAAALTHGINLSGWSGGWGSYSPERTDTYITAADFQTMHAMSIRFVRFPFDPMLLAQGGLLALGLSQP